MAGDSVENRAKKAATIERLYELFGQHKQILMANFTNVGSSQVQLIRKTLRAYNGQLVISKNVPSIINADSDQEDPEDED